MKRPNIIFIMTDQQRYDALGASGNDLIRTPNLDRLAGESASFASCFIQAPVCVPSRHTFFTGRYPHSHRCRVNYTRLSSSETLMQARLREVGYRTGFVGKLHYWPPSREFALSTGFDCGLIHDAGPTDEHSDYCAWLAEQAPELASDYRRCEPVESGNPFVAAIPESLHETTWCGEKSREMLRELASGDDPFFLFSSYWKPHAPFEVPQPWASMYDDVDIPLPPPESLDTVEMLPLPVQRLALRVRRPASQRPRDEALWMYRAYYAAVSQIDDQVGRTLDVLNELGIADETIVIFTSDHGDLLGEHGIDGKNAFYDPAIHVPFMLRYPSVVTPASYDDLVEGTDLLPTVFDLCGVPVHPSAQGRSFASLVTDRRGGGTYEPRTHVFAENIIPEVITGSGFDIPYEAGRGVDGIRHPDAKMVRTSRWKYVRYVDNGEELFDLDADPQERENLADRSEYADVKRDLKDALLDWLITADETDQIAPQWEVDDRCATDRTITEPKE